MKMNYPLVIVSVFVASIVLVAMLPNFIGATYTTEERTNDNAGWVRFNYTTGKTATIDYTITGGNLLIGGPSPQSGTADDMIIWADNNLSVYIKDGGAYFIGNNNGNISTGALSNTFTISKLSNGVRITDGGNTYNFPVSIWAYIPNSNGSYTSFINGDDSHTNGNNVNGAFVGGLFDIVAYNNYDNYGYDVLSLQVDQSDDIISGADWVPTANNPDNLDMLNFIPLDIEPITLAPLNPGNQLMSVPTPSYVDGDWGYNLDDENRAIIVSYSGSAGDITVPATVGGYPVLKLGSGSYLENVFNTSLSPFSVTVSPGIQQIGSYAFYGCTGLTSINIPTSVTFVSTNSFQGCTGLTSINVDSGGYYYSSENGVLFNNTKTELLIYPAGKTDLTYTVPASVTSIGTMPFAYNTYLKSIEIPASVTSIGGNTFYGCTGLTSIIIPGSVNTIPSSMFHNCTGLSSVIIKEGVREIGVWPFNGCTSLNSITIPSSITTISDYAFTSSSIDEVLNLSDIEITGNDYGLSGATIYTEVPGWFYLSNVHYTVTNLGNGSVYVLLRLIPVFFFIGLLIFITKKLKDRENYE